VGKKCLGRVKISNNAFGTQAAQSFMIASPTHTDEWQSHFLGCGYVPYSIANVDNAPEVVYCGSQANCFVQDIHTAELVVRIACERVFGRDADVRKLYGCGPLPPTRSDAGHEPFVSF